MRISDWSSDVCSSDLLSAAGEHIALPLLESILASLQLLAALRLHLLEVIFLSVEEDDAVGVLLKIAAFLEIGHHRPLVCARLNSARELRQRKDGDVELGCHMLHREAHRVPLLDRQ